MRVATACLVLIAAHAPLEAQLSTAAVNGSVRDASGSAIPGASVVLKNLATGVERSAASNDAGNYVFLSVAPGSYTLEGSHTGFQTTRIEPFTLEVNQTATFDLRLEVGQVQQSVNVSASGEEIQASTVELGSVIAQKASDRPASQWPQFHATAHAYTRRLAGECLAE